MRLQVIDLADLIKRYVTSHPEACDTVEGVREWWIPMQRHFDQLRDVQAALELLQADGHIHSRTGPDGRSRYAAKSDPA